MREFKIALVIGAAFVVGVFAFAWWWTGRDHLSSERRLQCL